LALNLQCKGAIAEPVKDKTAVITYLAK